MRYHVTHDTEFHASDRVSIGLNQVYLTPRTTKNQTCELVRITTNPPTTQMERWEDYYGNVSHYLSFERGYERLRIRAKSCVKVVPQKLPAIENSIILRDLRAPLVTDDPALRLLVAEMKEVSPRIDGVSESIREFSSSVFKEEKPVLVCLKELLRRFDEDFTFDSTATTVNTPIDEVLASKRGVCQDFSHLAIALCRAAGLATRYVSGYLRTHPPEGQERRQGTDASHAWLSVFCGPLGWVDLDPTNNLFVADEHITVAWGRDYSDVAPVKGVVIGSGTHSLSVSVDVEPIDEMASISPDEMRIN